MDEKTNPIIKMNPPPIDLVVASAEALCEAIIVELKDLPVNRIPTIAFHRQNLLLAIKVLRGEPIESTSLERARG